MNKTPSTKATYHWLCQRLSALLILGLVIFLLISFSLAPIPFLKPLNLLAMATIGLLIFYHGKLGLDVVMEDYIPNPRTRKFFLLLNAIFCWLCKLLTLVIIYHLWALHG